MKFVDARRSEMLAEYRRCPQGCSTALGLTFRFLQSIVIVLMQKNILPVSPPDIRKDLLLS